MITAFAICRVVNISFLPFWAVKSFFREFLVWLMFLYAVEKAN
jgi:hypothetical protein